MLGSFSDREFFDAVIASGVTAIQDALKALDDARALRQEVDGYLKRKQRLKSQLDKIQASIDALQAKCTHLLVEAGRCRICGKVIADS